MPTRKIGEVENPKAVCRDPEHNPPTHMVYEPGVWEHECPRCGRKIRFVVPVVDCLTAPIKHLKDRSDIWEEIFRCIQ